MTIRAVLAGESSVEKVLMSMVFPSVDSPEFPVRTTRGMKEEK